jgi:hypothetical protein
MSQLANYATALWDKLTVEQKVIIGNLFKLFGIVAGLSSSFEFLTKFENAGVNLVGFAFLSGFVWFGIGIIISFFLMLTGNFK